MPPLWQYFSRLHRTGSRAHGCPQRARIMDPYQFFPVNQAFFGGQEWGPGCRSWTLESRHLSAIS
jgi:hypothetical protein